MPKTPAIRSGGIKPLGEERSNPLAYYYKPGTKPQKPKRLRKGEVLHGTIQKILSTKSAIVRLPSGTFNCHLQGNLKKGDSLFFHVTETEPSLVLNPYAVSSRIGGKPVQADEIIRMLNVETSRLSVEIIDFLKENKSMVIRSDIQNILKGFNSVRETELRDKDFDQTLRTLYFFNDAVLKVSTRNFLQVYPLFTEIEKLSSSIQNLESTISDLSDDLYKDLKDIYKAVHSDNINPRELINFFTNRLFRNNDPFLKVLQYKLIQYNSEIMRNIVEFFDAQSSWNTLAEKNGKLIFYHLPLLIQNKIEILQLILDKETESNTKYDVPDLTKLSPDPAEQELLRNTGSELQRFLKMNKYILNTYSISSISQKMNIPYDDILGLQSEGFSIVV